MADVDYSDWFAGKAFSTDWTSTHIPTWTSVLDERRSAIQDVLEIGSWEGRSAIFSLRYFFQCHIVRIDTFAGSREFARC
jgi:hypothetical protein